MSYICPACNGLEQFSQPCTQCNSVMEDSGRVADYYGPYSPYRAYADIYSLSCQHMMQCPQCGYSTATQIQAQSINHIQLNF